MDDFLTARTLNLKQLGQSRTLLGSSRSVIQSKFFSIIIQQMAAYWLH